jgi:type IV pilus assembly protein PilW
MRADQLIVSGDDDATRANWNMVRSIKIGLILRSTVGATQETASQTLYPFGNARASASAALGSAFANSTNDPGTVVSAPADRRLRLQTSFTIHLRNEQNL